MQPSGLKHDDEGLDVTLHRELHATMSLRTDDGDGVCALATRRVVEANLVRVAERELDRGSRTRRNRLNDGFRPERRVDMDVVAN